MSIAEVRALYAYNRWANRRMFKASQLLNWQEFTKDLGARQGSVRGTVVHIVWGEWLWLRRWRGESLNQLFAPEEFSDWAMLESQWSAVEREHDTFLEHLTAELLTGRVSYEHFQGVRWEYSLAEMIQHVVNHSSYHRGQVAGASKTTRPNSAGNGFLGVSG